MSLTQMKAIREPARLTSRGLPDGYDTVIGYLVKVDPEAVELLMPEPIDAILGDQSKADAVASRRNVAVLLTEPPAALRGAVEHLRVYPVALLREVIGD